MLPSDDCDACAPEWAVKRRPSALAFSALPFILTFIIVAVGVSHKLFPLLSGRAHKKGPQDGVQLPGFTLRERPSILKNLRLSSRALASVTFSTNIALSAVLVELILCEISNTINPATRALALKITLPSLLFLLVIATPALEIHSVIAGAGWSFDKGKRRMAWLLELLGLAAWLTGFWYLGRGLLGSYLHEESYVRDHSFSEGCLERIGIIGISLMASLAGFAAVSSLWQTFGVKNRTITESDLARKQAGLDATNDMLLTKESRLRALQRKLSDAPQEGFMTRMVGSLRGNPDLTERSTLELEIHGLETMRTSLQNSILALQSRRQAQLRSHTAYGRILNAFSYVFSLYCLYRITATTFTTLRRFSSPTASFSNSDPINNVLAILAKHWDPSLDRVAWSRTISFLLSGVMLLASFNSVLQTFLLFARVVPSILQHTRANFALLISQISATYVISSALLLRSNLPSEMKSAISDALGAPLEPAFTERWFEGWFLTATALTVVGLFTPSSNHLSHPPKPPNQTKPIPKMSAPNPGRQSPDPEHQSETQAGTNNPDINEQGGAPSQEHAKEASESQKSKLESNPKHILADHAEAVTSKK
ncbi:hypothetical protein P154DRAFT_480852 [Amniculicola lignicola CBS 123094]|uniref:Abscisic acid G-protein coupled receptor-like domain-containing protein n=1 Tax=Amniculicola lignicola CBS 123094 TaxID=1392246 RepID=A0A6A5X0W9_9PLEO|nr:hypothetical protein P154DRAFT_480852 [Amniculicola lignicola CBS 123094]